MDIAALITVLTQLSLAGAAYKLANALKGRVDDHEVRIVRLEA